LIVLDLSQHFIPFGGHNEKGVEDLPCFLNGPFAPKSGQYQRFIVFLMNVERKGFSIEMVVFIKSVDLNKAVIFGRIPE